MSAQLWSWLLAVSGVTGMWFVGRKRASAFFFLSFNETLWIVFAIQTEQYGFIFMAVIYASVYFHNGMRWVKDV